MSVIDESNLDNARLLRHPGVAFEFGCSKTDIEKFIKLAGERYPGTPYCLLGDWVVCDMRISDAEMKIFEANSTKPIIVHAKFVIDEQTGTARYGYFRISTHLVEMSDPCFFVTRNIVYILVGSGTRKAVDPKDVIAIYFDE